MSEGRPMDLLALLRALDARIIATTADTLAGQCPVCGVGTDLDQWGHGRACLRCSCVEVGESWPGLAHRVSHHLTLNQWRKLDTIEDVPRYRYREWVRKFMR